ncbi:SDR family oxidoreductase [Zunongwangia sp.]|uniref:SDR family oxidoreductase n=1 Tax=Zunongwangia sp. TaxID=1965325 RepID=UPI003AA863B7
MEVLVIGAHGKIGKLVTQKMQRAVDFDVTAFIRKEEQKGYFNELGVKSIVGDLEASVEEIAEKLKGFDTIVFTAGSGGKTGDDKTLEIDLDGAVKTMLAAQKNAIKRYVMVSAAYADDRSKWKATGLKPYYVAKHFADLELKRSNLDYTIIRPVSLTDDNGKGLITLTKSPENLQKEIARADVAEVILESLRNKKSIKEVIEISEGNDSIKEAIAGI